MLKSLLFGGLLAAGVSTTVIRQEIIADTQSCNVKSQGILNELSIVPLLDIARTGLLPPAIEEGLLAALGPRFLNVFLENARIGAHNAHSADFQCAFKCANTVISLVPCIATAMLTENPITLLSCGLPKEAICNCGKCLPDQVEEFTNKLCSDNSISATAVNDEMLSYPDYIEYSKRAPYLAGLRGDLKETAIEEARALYNASAAPSMSPHTKNLFGFCPGSKCGGVCCLGVCVMDNSCLGATL